MLLQRPEAPPRAPELWLYDLMSRLGRLSYPVKIMAVAFVGIHVPLIAIVAFAALRASADWNNCLVLVGIALAATLTGTAVTLLVLHHLLRPVLVTSQILRAYRCGRELRPLPTHYTDEVGTLMADAASTLKHLERALERLEHFDAMTGLPNRQKLLEEAERRVAGRRRFAACAIRLHAHARLSEALALDAAEMAATEIATRLGAALDHKNTLYRLGGGDFLFLEDVPAGSSAAIGLRVGKILARCGGILSAGGVDFMPVLTAGIAIFPDDAPSASAVIDRAIGAIASAEGETKVGFHSPPARQAVLRRLRLEHALRRAVAERQFELHYQPVVDLAARRVVGAEALLRWRDPMQGLVSPRKFLSAAEEFGLMDAIGRWALRAACLQAAEWNCQGLPKLQIAINLSARQFRGHLIDLVAETLQAVPLEPGQLEIELTETAALSDENHTRAMFGRLRDLGVSIAIDDFGTGYANMSSLGKLPFDKLKIDREFVREVDRKSRRQAICAVIMTLARGLDLRLVAEGVETADEVAFLYARGCRLFQGYFFSPPLPAADFRARVGAGELATACATVLSAVPAEAPGS